MDSEAQAASCSYSGENTTRREPAQSLLFFRNFLRHPGRVGWLLPSSSYVVDSVLKDIDWSSTLTIIEYGPGTGTFTRAILNRMRPDAKLVAFEIDPSFSEYLRMGIADSRFHLVQQSATEAHLALPKLGIEGADCIISGIPFKPLSHELRTEIALRSKNILGPDGQFLVYQFSGAVRPYLLANFITVREKIELRNIVPTRIFTCRDRD